MSGPGESSNLAVQRLQKKANELENFEKKFELAENPLLNLSREDISKMTSEECGETSYELSVLGLIVQKALNKQLSYLHWLESKLNLTIANDLNNYEGYYSFEQRRTVAVVNNEYAKQLEEIRISVQMKVDILSGLPFQINQISKCLVETQISKRHQYQRG